MPTTNETLTTQQIEALRAEARAAGDETMAQTCTEALAGNDAARQVVLAAIKSAEAMHPKISDFVKLHGHSGSQFLETCRWCRKDGGCE